MALDINTNLSSLYLQSLYSNNSSNVVNPANSAISQVLTAEAAGYYQGANNADQGVSLVQTATAGLGQTLNMLQQMNTIATESASGTLSSTQLSDLQTVYSQLQAGVNYIANATQFNNIPLLQNPSSSLAIQVGSSSADTVNVNLPQATTTALGVASTDVNTAADAATAITALTNAINNISTDVAGLGASQLSLQNASSQDKNIATNLITENSTITDNSLINPQTSINNLLDQAAILMLANSNATSGSVLHLLPEYQAGSFINMKL